MYLNFDNQVELKKQIESLQPSKGVCIFIDICGSTAIKQKDLKTWIILIGNSIRSCVGISNLFSNNVIKLIGDEIMIFIPEDSIIEANENYAIVLDHLKTVISTFFGNEIDSLTLKTKAAIHFCNDTYNISYSSSVDDYYGNDIDLTARLMKKSEENKIVISKIFYQMVNSVDSSFLKNSSEVNEEQFKGIVGKTGYRILTIK